MAYLDVGPLPQDKTLKKLFGIFRSIETAVNKLDKNNFPNGIEGDIIKENTLSGGAIIDRSLPLIKLPFKEWFEPLVLPAQAFQTTSTTGVDVGGYFAWDPSNYPTGDWYLEVSMASANSAATATCTLAGVVDVGSVSTTSTTLTRLRSGVLTMPTLGQNLWVKLKTSNASYAAILYAARLVFVPK